MIKNVNIKDTEELLEIYKPYVLNTAISFEYDVPSIDEFKKRIINISSNYPYLVYEKDGIILGYAYASSYNIRESYRFCAETSIYVKSEYLHRGIGKKLYTELENQLKKQGIVNLYACIATTAKDDNYLTNNSINFHKHMGYNIVGTFKKCGYKFNKWYDMTWVEKSINKKED